MRINWYRPIPISIVFCFFVGMASPGGLSETSERVDRLQREVPKLMKAAGIPGLSIAVVEGAKLRWVGGLGVRDVRTREPVDEDTVFEAASLSKPVVAAALLQLVARGDFDLERPLAEILEYPRLIHDERYRKITARMVLAHTTGLPNWGGTPLRLIRDPGTRWGYSGEGFVYLQKALEETLHQRLEEILRQEVFAPLAMTRSSFLWQDSYADNVAIGHDELERPQALRKRTTENAAASLMTTAREYGRFLETLFSQGALAPNTLDLMSAFQTRVAGWGDPETHDFVGWGLGWGIQEGDRGTALWHWGDNGSFRCFVILYPEKKDGLVYFTNSMNGLSIARAMLETAFPDQHRVTRFLSYDAYDEPKRTARIALRKTFLEAGSEAGKTMLAVLRKATPSITDAPFLSALGEFLLEEEKTEDGLFVLESNASAHPDIEQAQQDYAEGLVRANRLQEAISIYEADRKSPSALRRIRWVKELLEARRNPPEISEGTLELLAGAYGPRQVRLREGWLFYEREGSGREYRLYPIGDNLFGLEGLNTFRLKFIPGADQGIVKVIGHYFDGQSDENPRDPD